MRMLAIKDRVQGLYGKSKTNGVPYVVPITNAMEYI